MEETAMDENIKALIDDLVNGDEAARRYAAEDLGYAKCEEAIPELVKGLADEHVPLAEACADALVRIGTDQVAKTISPYLSSEHVSLRNHVAEILSLLGEISVPYMEKQLASDDRDVRKFAVDTLSLIQSPKSTKALIIALDDKDVNIAASAADGLGDIGSEEHLDVLEKYLDASLWMKCSVIRGIGNIGGSRALNLIVSVIDDDNMMVKLSVVHALKNMKEVGSIPYLLGILIQEPLELYGSDVISAIYAIIEENPGYDFSLYNRNDLLESVLYLCLNGSPDIQVKAIEIIGAIKNHENSDGFKEFYRREGTKVEEVIADNYVEQLITLFFSEDSQVRRSACYTVISIKPEDLNPLEAVLNDPESPMVSKAAAIHCIGRSGHTNTFEILRKFLTIDDAVLPRVVLDTLSGGVTPVPVEEIIDLLHSDIASIRESAAKAMGRIAIEDFVEPLISRLDDSECEVVDAIDKALFSIGEHNTNSIIVPYLDSLSSPERKVAFEYFSFHNPEQKIDNFLIGLDDKDPAIRALSFKVLSNLKGITIDAVEKGLSDANEAVQVQAVRSLSYLEATPELFSRMKKILEESVSERVKVEVVKCLESYHQFGSVEILKFLLDSPSTWVQIETVEVLRNIGDDSIVDELKELLDSENDDLVETVQSALDELEF